jgi:hypothetical protein
MEELFEIWTWAQLGIHRKPCVILNVAGYFDPLLQFVDRLVSEGFLQRPAREMMLKGLSAEEALRLLDDYQPPEVDRWIGEGET